MNHKFCIHCSAKNYYEGMSPKFCSKCGKALSGGVVEAHQKQQEAEEKLEKPHNLEVEVEGGATRRETLRNAILDNPVQKHGDRTARPSRLDGKDVIADTLKECSQVKGSKSID